MFPRRQHHWSAEDSRDDIIDELETVTRGPYTGCLGYLGFNRESQLNILIRSAVCREGMAYYHAGAGIVADSLPDAEFEETLAKAAGFLRALPGPVLRQPQSSSTEPVRSTSPRG